MKKVAWSLASDCWALLMVAPALEGTPKAEALAEPPWAAGAALFADAGPADWAAAGADADPDHCGDGFCDAVPLVKGSMTAWIGAVTARSTDAGVID